MPRRGWDYFKRFCSFSICPMLLSGVGKSSGMVPPELLDSLAYLPADLEVGSVCSFPTPDVLAAQFFICLRGAEKIRSQLGAAHVIEDVLPLLQTLSGVDFLCSQTAVQPLIALVLEDGKVPSA